MRTDAPTTPAGPTLEQPEPEFDRARGKRTTILVLVLIGLMGSLWVIGPFVFESRDDPTAIDSKAVRPTVSQACKQLRDDLKTLPAGMAVPQKAEAENRAAEQLVGRVRSLGPETLAKDEPVDRWLADWEQIVATRRRAVQDGKRFSTPVSDNAPINVRMFSLIRSGLEQCDVPEALLAPQPGSL